jgi:hypothetical protein
MVTVWSEPNRLVRGYMRSGGSSGRSNDPETKPIRLGAMRLDANDFVPPVCPPKPEATPAPSPRPVCDGTLQFVLDGTSPPPSVEISASGVAHLRAVSNAPPRFDPRRFALQVTVRGGGYPPTEILDASLPGGARWAATARGTSWSYDDPAGLHDGISHVLVAPTGPERNRLAWEIEVHPRRTPVSPPSVFDWNAVFVGMRLQGVPDEPGACGSVFLPVRSSSGGCVLDPTTDGVRCTVSSPTPECDASDVDGRVRCTIGDTARAQETFYARRV